MQSKDFELKLLVKNCMVQSMSAPHKQGISELKKKFSLPIHGLKECSQGVE